MQISNNTLGSPNSLTIV